MPSSGSSPFKFRGWITIRFTFAIDGASIRELTFENSSSRSNVMMCLYTDESTTESFVACSEETVAQLQDEGTFIAGALRFADSDKSDKHLILWKKGLKPSPQATGSNNERIRLYTE